jgi:hypothetical protein
MQRAVKEPEGQHPDVTLSHLRGYSKILPEDHGISGASKHDQEEEQGDPARPSEGTPHKEKSGYLLDKHGHIVFVVRMTTHLLNQC